MQSLPNNDELDAENQSKKRKKVPNTPCKKSRFQLLLTWKLLGTNLYEKLFRSKIYFKRIDNR